MSAVNPSISEKKTVKHLRALCSLARSTKAFPPDLAVRFS